MNPYKNREPSIAENAQLRIPQREGYAKLVEYAAERGAEREVGIVLPVGCGKTGLIAITPFAFRARRTLVVAPSLTIYTQLAAALDPTRPNMFCRLRGVLGGAPFPEPVPLREERVTVNDLEVADIVIANIQQLQGGGNRWLNELSSDFFDLILVDEGHHNVADSWDLLRRTFPDAPIVNFSATPVRADGQLMAGRILYSFSVAEAIGAGYCKRLKAIVLNPRTLRYARREDGQEVEVSLDEVIRLGEQEASFRRAIVSSAETLNTIVSASITALRQRRDQTNDQRHKIIASALNYEHCTQIVEAYRARGMRADYIHSREDTRDRSANQRILRKLEDHELDVIVQVRKLGEGFDHPYLSVAAVFSIFRELSPFVQFVGRVMRSIVPGEPENSLNEGVVIFHAGANVAQRWQDFQKFSLADQEYFNQLLPIEGLDFTTGDEIEVQPRPASPRTEIRSQDEVYLQEIPLLEQDEEARRAYELLRSRGFTSSDFARAERLAPVTTTRFRAKQAAGAAIDDRVRIRAAQVISERGLNPGGRELDRQRRDRTNLVVLKSAIDRQIYTLLGRAKGARRDLREDEIARVNDNLDGLIEQATQEVFNG